jgi:phosphatidylinositol alpha-1,6-mannosyltransferase
MKVRVPPVARLGARVDVAQFRPGLDAASVRTRLGIGAEAKVVLCFGRLVPRKGVDRLIAAMPEIARSIPGATLVVGGTGPEEPKLRRLADRTDAAVVFAGRVPDEEAGPLYATADVFALPVVDRWFGLEIEGLGVVLLEASACETPCVTGNSGGTPEAVLDGVTGYVIDGRNRAALVDRVVHLLADDELRSSLGAAARRHVEENFSASLPPEPLLEWLG